MRATRLRLLSLRWGLLLAVGLLVAAPLLAGHRPPPGPPPHQGAWVWSGDAESLQSLSLCELDDLYRRAGVNEPPHGWLPGKVIVFTNMPAPKMVKKLSETFWRGKHIEPDGHFTNQWRNRTALESYLTVGPSYVDCQPCLVFEYPRWTPLFGPMRDEYREIAPGLFLGRMYRRTPYVRFLGYNYLQLSPSDGCASCVLMPEPPLAPVQRTSAVLPISPFEKYIEPWKRK